MHESVKTYEKGTKFKCEIGHDYTTIPIRLRLNFEEWIQELGANSVFLVPSFFATATFLIHFCALQKHLQ